METHHILAVIPDLRDRRVLQFILRGLNVSFVCSGRDALLFAWRHPVSAVICDAELPDGTWDELLAELGGPKHAPPVVIASRLADDRMWVEVMDLGATDLVAKPFDRHAVLRALGSRSANADHQTVAA